MPAKRKVTAEAKTVGEVLRRPVFYRVPTNQRDYAWTQEEVDILWQDVTDALAEDRDEYFLGAIVLSLDPEDASEYAIVDGQQRLATLSMIFAAIRIAWGTKEQAQEVFDTYLGTKDRKTRETTPKLTLNATNAPIFQQVVLDQKELSATQFKTEPKSNQLLVKAFARLKGLLDEWVKKQSSIDDALVALEHFIDRSANIIVIEVGDESDAFIIFETLNDRGLELAVADLVKNYLFSLAGKRNIEAFKKLWTETTQIVGGENLTAFLRHYWISEYKLLRERDLYRNLRIAIKGETTARNFLTRLRSLAEFYAALLSPDHAFWGGIANTPRFIRALRLLRAAQFRPLALAVMDGGKPDEITSMLRIVLDVTFRYYVTGKGTNDLERGYSDAAIATRRSGKRNAKAVFSLLKGLYIADKEFADAFARASFSRSDTARYVLGELNHALESDAAAGVSDDVSLEHILPRNPSSAWKALPPQDELPYYVDLIGNLTLLEKGANRGLGNKDFKTKQTTAYSKSKLAINSSLSGLKKWTAKEIDDRCDALAKTATKIWKVSL